VASGLSPDRFCACRFLFGILLGQSGSADASRDAGSRGVSFVIGEVFSRRGVYHGVPELIAAIEQLLDGYGQRAQPSVSPKAADQGQWGDQEERHFRDAALGRLA